MRMVRTLVVLLLVSFPALASPNQYLRLQGYPTQGYIAIPFDTHLDTEQMTVEAWVSVRDARANSACSSIAGDGYITGWWLGLCGTTMRSYFNGVASGKTSGLIPDSPGTWIHIAAVTDGTTRRHYINGTLVLETAETAAQSSVKEIRIGSDPDWNYMAAGTIDDLRIWSVARTQEQIRQTMFVRAVPSPEDIRFQSLEAWYRFEGNAMDSWRTHHGTILGEGISFETGQVITVPAKRRAMH